MEVTTHIEFCQLRRRNIKCSSLSSLRIIWCWWCYSLCFRIMGFIILIHNLNTQFSRQTTSHISYICKGNKLNCHKSLSKLPKKNQSKHDSLWFHVGVYILAGSEDFLDIMLVLRENGKTIVKPPKLFWK